MDNFKEIATRFKQIYSEIATKWEAYLDLENLENPFEGGVNIKVRITGNKCLDIKGLYRRAIDVVLTRRWKNGR